MRKSRLFPHLLDEAEWVTWPASTRLVWITLLAMADPNGEIDAHISAVARNAQVPLKETTEAIKTMEKAFPLSRHTAHQGRTLEKTARGWKLLQFANYGR